LPVRPAEEPDDALSGVLAGLAVSARRANLARSEVLAQALQLLTEGRLGADQRAAAQAAAHSIVGSAGTFGAHRASELAALLEHYLSGGDDDLANGLAQARARLEELRRDLRADHQVEE